MKNQKTVAKWLAIVLLVTVAVGSYILYDALYVADSGEAGAETEVGEKDTDSDTDGSGETVREIIRSTLPRDCEMFGQAAAQHAGGSGADSFFDAAYWNGKYFAVVSSGSVDRDFEKASLYMCCFTPSALLSVTRFSESGETFTDMKLSSDGLTVLTSASNLSRLYRFSALNTITAVNDIEKLTDGQFYLDGGVLRLFGTTQNCAVAFTISNTLTENKSNFIYSKSGLSLSEILPAPEGFDLFLTNGDGNIEIVNFQDHSGFKVPIMLNKLDFLQIECFVFEGELRYLILGIDEGGDCAAVLLNGAFNTLAQYAFEGESNGRLFISDEKIFFIGENLIAALCKHLDLIAYTVNGYKGADIIEKAEFGGNQYIAAYLNNTVKLLAFDADAMALNTVWSYAADNAAAEIFTSSTTLGMFFNSSSASLLGGMNFGNRDCFFVSDEINKS